MDQSPVFGWWIVDPVTGRTRDELHNGLAGAGTTVRIRPGVQFGNMPGYTFLQRAIMWIVAKGKVFLCIGILVFWGAFISGMVMASTLARIECSVQWTADTSRDVSLACINPLFWPDRRTQACRTGQASD